MTKERMIELLKIEQECVNRAACDDCKRICDECSLVQDDEELREMYRSVIKLLEEQKNIVHCKECKYVRPLNAEWLGCSCLVEGISDDYLMTVKPDSYCCWGEHT